LALFGRAAGGLGFVMAVALALAGDSFQGRSRDRAAGRMLAAEALAWVAGVPIIAVATQLVGWRSSLAGFGLLALALAVLAAFILPRRTSPSQATTPKQALWAIWQEHHSRPDLLLVLVANGLRNTYWVGFTTYAGAFYVATFGLATWQLAPILAVCAIGYIVGTETGGRLVSRLGPARLTAIGCGSAALLLALLPQVPLLGASLVVVAASCVFSGAANSALIAWILRLASEQRGATLALNSALTNLGAALGAAACGAGILLLGYTGLGLAAASLAVLAAGAAAWSAARGARSATGAAIRS
jgi:DHA1 family chloramphenicol resistance protein-like MFS transporter